MNFCGICCRHFIVPSQSALADMCHFSTTRVGCAKFLHKVERVLKGWQRTL